MQRISFYGGLDEACFCCQQGETGQYTRAVLSRLKIAEVQMSALGRQHSRTSAPGGSHPHRLQMQKSLLIEQAFKFGR